MHFYLNCLCPCLGICLYLCVLFVFVFSLSLTFEFEIIFFASPHMIGLEYLAAMLPKYRVLIR